MIRFFVPIFLACVAQTAAAADVGIGVPVSSNQQALYLPIQVSDVLRVEPLVSYQSETLKFESTKVRRDELAVGLGIFRGVTASEATGCYAGARAGYVLERSDEEQAEGTANGRNNGFFVAPTFGCEYRIGAHVAIAGELDVRYDHRSGDIPFREEISTIATGTHLIVRFTP